MYILLLIHCFEHYLFKVYIIFIILFNIMYLHVWKVGLFTTLDHNNVNYSYAISSYHIYYYFFFILSVPLHPFSFSFCPFSLYILSSLYHCHFIHSLYESLFLMMVYSVIYSLIYITSFLNIYNILLYLLKIFAISDIHGSFVLIIWLIKSIWLFYSFAQCIFSFFYSINIQYFHGVHNLIHSYSSFKFHPCYMYYICIFHIINHLINIPNDS